jgi:alkylresorcinol/alkylpyrone synthase
MQILSVGRATPPHRYEQEELLAAFTAFWASEHHNPARVSQLHRAVQVGGRNLALPMEDYLGLDFSQANDAFIRVGTDIGTQALKSALDAAQLKPSDVDAIFFTTVTGVAAPSIDARIVNRLGLRSDVKRTPIFGLGCVAGTAGIARVADFLRGWPDKVAVLVSVELCSLTLQRTDLSIPNLIASGLFGDGASAVVAVGSEHPCLKESNSTEWGPRVRASQSRFYADTERVMGWDIGQSGFKIVLSAEVPSLVRRHLRQDVNEFLQAQGLELSDIQSWVCHSGGPKVLEAVEGALDLPKDSLELSWRSLQEVGNLSSSSVLFVLHDTIREAHPAPGSLGMMIAMGPGFCAELVLLEW